MNIAQQRIKDILDRECYEIIHQKQCEIHNTVTVATPCWVCHKNEALAYEIYEASKKEEVKV